MRRIKLILATAASMAVLMVLAAAPALADTELNQSIGGSSPATVVGSTGGNVELGGDNDIELGGDNDDNDIDLDDNNIDGVRLLGNVDDDLDNCERFVVIDGQLVCVDDDNDFVSGLGGVSQSFEEENAVSGDVEPSISIG